MQTIKTITIRLTEANLKLLKDYQEQHRQRYGMPINQSHAFNKLLEDYFKYKEKEMAQKYDEDFMIGLRRSISKRNKR